MVKEFFVVGSDDHSNDNPKIGNTDLRHVSLFLLLLLFPSFPLALASPSFYPGRILFSFLDWILWWDNTDISYPQMDIEEWPNLLMRILIGKYVRWVKYPMGIWTIYTLSHHFREYVFSPSLHLLLHSPPNPTSQPYLIHHPLPCSSSSPKSYRSCSSPRLGRIPRLTSLRSVLMSATPHGEIRSRYNHA
jgi:hypothetical protein